MFFKNNSFNCVFFFLQKEADPRKCELLVLRPEHRGPLWEQELLGLPQLWPVQWLSGGGLENYLTLVLVSSFGCELSPFPFVQRSMLKDLLCGWCALSAEWGLQQTHPSTVHGASEPRRVWWTSNVWDTQDPAVGQLSDAVMQEVQ